MYEKKKKAKLILLRIWNIIGKDGDGSQRGREVEARALLGTLKGRLFAPDRARTIF